MYESALFAASTSFCTLSARAEPSLATLTFTVAVGSAFSKVSVTPGSTPVTVFEPDRALRVGDGGVGSVDVDHTVGANVVRGVDGQVQRGQRAAAGDAQRRRTALAYRGDAESTGGVDGGLQLPARLVRDLGGHVGRGVGLGRVERDGLRRRAAVDAVLQRVVGAERRRRREARAGGHRGAARRLPDRDPVCS